MRTAFVTVILSGALASMAGCALLGDKREAIGGNPDAMFMTDVAFSANQEVAFNEVAQQRAGDQRVRELVQQMLQDHRRSTVDLQRLADDRRVKLPRRASELTVLRRDHLEDIAADQFDQRYLALIIADHAQLLATLEHTARTSRDSEIRQFAASQAPVVRHHLEQAEQIQSDLLRRQGFLSPPSVLPRQQTEQSQALRSDQRSRQQEQQPRTHQQQHDSAGVQPRQSPDLIGQ